MNGSRRYGRGHRTAAEDAAFVDATGGRGRTDSGHVAVYEAGREGGGARPAAADKATGWLRRTPPLRRWLRGGGTNGGPTPWTRPQDDLGRDCVDMAARDGRMGCRRGRGRVDGRGGCRRGRGRAREEDGIGGRGSGGGHGRRTSLRRTQPRAAAVGTSLRTRPWRKEEGRPATPGKARRRSRKTSSPWTWPRGRPPAMSRRTRTLELRRARPWDDRGDLRLCGRDSVGQMRGMLHRADEAVRWLRFFCCKRHHGSCLQAVAVKLPWPSQWPKNLFASVEQQAQM